MRPLVDLEGSTLPASEAVRESAEGVVGASIHTDGDGQDDRWDVSYDSDS